MTLLRLKSSSEAQTAAIGARLAQCLAAGDVIALSGPLGAGKSVLARAAIRALVQDPEIEAPSPSFTLVQLYEARDGTPVWHVDLYRLSSPEELVELGLEEAFDSAIALIEWPERAAGALPETRLELRLDLGGEGERSLTFEGPQDWAPRLHPLAEMRQ